MHHPVRLFSASVLAFAFTLAACGDEDPSPTKCTESQLCREACCSVDETCVDDVCQPKAAQCEAGQTACGTACCDNATEHCEDGACMPGCAIPCGDTCCGEREACDVFNECVRCPLESELADFVALDGRSDWNPEIGGSGYAIMRANHPSGEATVRLMLWNGYGAFEDGIHTGTYVLEGDRLDFGRCDVCVFMTIYDSDEEVIAEYMATGGTIEVTDFSIANGLRAKLSNVTFEQANIIWDGMKMEPGTTNCTTSIASGTYGGPLPPQCDPMNSACDPGFSCQYWSGLGFVCRVSEGVDLWEDCYYSYECRPGLDCLGAVPRQGLPGDCVELCIDKDDCSFLASSCVYDLFPHDITGYCSPCAAKQACGSVCCEDYQSCESNACVDKPCPVDSLLGEFDSTGWTDPGNLSVLEVPVPSTEGRPDLLRIELRDVQPGTFTLDGLELSYDTCTICVTLVAFDATGALVGNYFATGGTVELEAVDGGISATLHDVGFRRVQLDDWTVPHPQECTSSLELATISSSGLCQPTPAQACGPSCCSASEYCDVFAETPVCVAATTPPNDTCGTNGANVIALTLDAPPISGQTIGATANYSPTPFSCGIPFGALGVEVVYSYTPNKDGTFYVTVTPAFDYYPVLWVSSGTCGDGDGCIASTDSDRYSPYADYVTIEGTAGTVYYIYVDDVVDNASAAPPGGVFTIAVRSTAD